MPRRDPGVGCSGELYFSRMRSIVFVPVFEASRTIWGGAAGTNRPLSPRRIPGSPGGDWSLKGGAMRRMLRRGSDARRVPHEPIMVVNIDPEQHDAFQRKCDYHARRLTDRWRRALLADNERLRSYLLARLRCFERFARIRMGAEHCYPTSKRKYADGNEYARANHSAHNAVSRIARNCVITSRIDQAEPC